MRGAQESVVGNVLQKGRQAADEAGPAQPKTNSFDVWTHTGDALQAQWHAPSFQSALQAKSDPATVAAANSMASFSFGETGASLKAQSKAWMDGVGEFRGKKKDEDTDLDQNSRLYKVTKGFELLTSAEQLFSTLFSVIPFPALPAVRILDFVLGLPHAHLHPPFLPPIPTLGPVLPIPFLSGASKTLINGRPAARCGDMGLAIWCGGYFPMYEIFLGSSSVWIESMRAARLAVDISLHCAAPDRGVGLLIGLPISASSNVRIGGVPLPSIAAMVMGGALKGVGKLAGKAGRLGAKRSRAMAARFFSRKGCLGARVTAKLGLKEGGLAARAVRNLLGEPIDAVTGDYADYRTDFAYNSILPLSLERVYAGKGQVNGLLGGKWICNWSQRLLYDRVRGTVIYEDAEGQRLVFSVRGPSFFHRHAGSPHYTLSGSRRHARIFDERTQQTWHFRAESNRASAAQLEALEDRNGNRVRFEYREGRLAEVVHSDGLRILVETTAEGWLRSVSVPGEKDPLVHYTYDGKGQLADVLSRFFGEFHFTYTEQGWLSSWADSGPTKAMLSYDAEGRVIATHTSEGNLYNDRFKYDPKRRHTVYINALREETRIWYDAAGLVVLQENGVGEVASTERDALGRAVAVTDSIGRTLRSHYDDDGRLASQIDWAGRKQSFQYDDCGNLIVLSDAGGETQWFYDERGNLLETVLPDGRKLAHRYDGKGRLLSTEFPDGTAEHWEYETNGRLNGHVDALGNRTAFRQDLWGRTTLVSDAQGNTTTYDYALGAANPRGALSRLVRPDGGEERFEYDGESCLFRQSGAEGQTTRYTHGAYDLLRSVVDPLGHATRFDYDDAARLSGIANAAGQRWTLEYDAAGRLAREIDWGGRATEYRRDAVGRIIAKRLPDGSIQQTEWDERDRIVAVKAGRQRIEYEYDRRDRLTRAVTYRASDSDAEKPLKPETDIRFEYDGQDRLTREIQNGRTIDYRYDIMGRLVGRTSPSGATEWEFDALGLLAGMSSNGHGFQFSRDELGLERTRAHVRPAPPGDDTRPSQAVGGFFLGQDYDVCGRLIRQSAGRWNALAPSHKLPVPMQSTASRDFRWDKSGRLVGIDDSLRGPSAYRYDPRDQIQAVERPSGGRLGSERYDYDALLNLTASGPGSVHSYREGCVEQVGNSRYRYDERGRAVERVVHEDGFRPQVWRYGWDEFDHLTDVTTPTGEHWRYTYDAFGRRVRKQCLTAEKGNHFRRTEYVWQGATLAEEWKIYADGTSSAPTRTDVSRWHFEPGSFAPLAKETLSAAANDPIKPDAGSDFWPIVTDTVSAPLELYDSEGQCVWQAERRLWGRTHSILQQRPANDDQTVQDCNLRFPGQWEDEESGLHYNLYRYYDPDSGQYLSPDPIGLEGGLRTQGYVHDPVGWVDEWGLSGYIQEGGAHSVVRKSTIGGEVNHMPAYAAYKKLIIGGKTIGRSAGPAIWMTTVDHSYTQSWKRFRGAIIHQAAQRLLIRRGKWIRALEMDVRDVMKKFGHEYDESIRKCLDHSRQLGVVTQEEIDDLIAKCKIN